MWESVDSRKDAFFLNDGHTEVYYINITTSTEGTHSSSNFGNSRLIILTPPRSLESLLSYSSQSHSVKRQRRSCSNVPVASHLSKTQRQNLRMAEWPHPLSDLSASPLPCPYCPSFLAILQIRQACCSAPSCPLSPLFGNPFPRGPTRFAPSAHSGLCSNLSFRGFCRPPCIKDHTPPAQKHTLSLSSYHHLY